MTMPALEPSLERFPNPFLRYVAATRPAFLSITLVAVLIGLASAHCSGFPLQIDKSLLTLFFALVAHAGMNVINDYHDFMSGADRNNEGHLFPFTGGSRFIPNGVLSPRGTKIFGYTLLLSVIPAGLWLMRASAPGLFWIGLAGLFAGWAYSAPPLKLVSRGLGEPAILAGWALIAVGADFVQRGGFSSQPWLAGVPFALLVVNILYINQFPDRISDHEAGKDTLIVRLGTERARWGYLLIALLAYLWLLFAVAKSWLPIYAAAGAFALPLSFSAARDLLAHAATPALLLPAIKRTILAANLSGLLTALGLWMAFPTT
ncbi:MAG: prenyltransferase [Zoogloeaceae bacterium]|jgi:1,4-dihydroxy-2-naphthoate octaprenyltransferase|nr:prenyltransferase [Zoogloeaceae bacterium]